MANKREFKKYATAVGASLCEDMMVYYYNVPGINKEEVEKGIGKVLAAVEQAVCNANVFFDKGRRGFESDKAYSKAKKEFFKKLFEKINSDFKATLDEAVKEFNAAVPASVKEENKAALAH